MSETTRKAALAAPLMLAVPLLVSAPAVRGAEPPDVQEVRALAGQGDVASQVLLGGLVSQELIE